MDGTFNSAGDRSINRVDGGPGLRPGLRPGDSGRRRRNIGRAGLLILAASGLGTGSGCEVDCEAQYCKFVRAGQSGVFAYHYRCCVDPDAATCDEYAERIHGFSQRAAEMYAACADRDWDRLGEVWGEIKGLLPLGIVAIVAENFCDGYGWTARNAWTPFDPDDRIDADVAFDPLPVRMRMSTTDRAAIASKRRSERVEVVRRWRSADRSTVDFDFGDSFRRFRFTGEVQAVEGSSRPSLQESDVSTWCRNLEIEALDWRLRSDAGDLDIALVPDSGLNRLHAVGGNRFILAALVRVSFVERMHPGLEFDGEFDEVFLEVPCELSSGGTLRLLASGDAAAMSVWPIDPGLESYLGGTPTRTAGDDVEHDECVAQAIEMADYFRSLHDCP